MSAIGEHTMHANSEICLIAVGVFRITGKDTIGNWG